MLRTATRPDARFGVNDHEWPIRDLIISPDDAGTQISRADGDLFVWARAENLDHGRIDRLLEILAFFMIVGPIASRWVCCQIRRKKSPPTRLSSANPGRPGRKRKTEA